MLGIFFQFLLELIRALLIDALSVHVRRKLARWLGRCASRDCRRALAAVQRRNRERLFNRLLTAADDDL